MNIIKSVKKIGQIIIKLKIIVKSKYYKDKLPYYCPCCQTYLSEFSEGGFLNHPEIYDVRRYREIDQSVVCPICGSFPRHRILVSWLEDKVNILLNKNILYFAKERSVGGWLSYKGVNYTTADLYAEADLKLDIENTGLEDASYDVIICNHVLEHVTDYRKALQELYRITRSGGFLILSFPVDKKLKNVYENTSITTVEDRIEHFGQADHLRVFGGNITDIFEDAGFRVTEIQGKDYSEKIKPVIGPADYDYDVLWCLNK